MFCYQCEQTHRGNGCTATGVCGKDAEVAALQDLLVHVAKACAQNAHAARCFGRTDRKIDHYLLEALFITVTNVSFDPARISAKISEGRQICAQASALAGDAAHGYSLYLAFGDTLSDRITAGLATAIDARNAGRDRNIVALEELLVYGVKGIAAYAQHARVLGQEDDTVYAFIAKALAAVAAQDGTVESLYNLCMEAGNVNLVVMEMLDRAHTTTYGHPEPTRVRVDPIPGKCILVSGHDLKDLEELLVQTAGKGINVYTHGEMLPALAYPQLKKFPHLVGNYGGAWQDQQREFSEFPGAVLMTTNCIQRPLSTYSHRIFTSGLVAWPGVYHVDNHNFAPVIEAALQAPGFSTADSGRRITIGFAHNAVLSVANTVVGAVKSGAIRHFFLIGGCDGARNGRDYYTEFAESVPDDCVILTLACGKYRFNKLEFGEIGGIPRLLDCGQCNDAYSAIKIAGALAQAFGCGVNDLPLSLVLSWYEQKAVCILLTLLSLGIKDIRLGPTLPAFLTPDIVGVLVEKFSLKPIGTVEADLHACLAGL
jgi:hydroxylamine reductase